MSGRYFAAAATLAPKISDIANSVEIVAMIGASTIAAIPKAKRSFVTSMIPSTMVARVKTPPKNGIAEQTSKMIAARSMFWVGLVVLGASIGCEGAK